MGEVFKEVIKSFIPYGFAIVVIMTLGFIAGYFSSESEYVRGCSEAMLEHDCLYEWKYGRK